MAKFPEPLSAKVEGSFAYLTVRDRLPAILGGIVDSLCRRKCQFSAEQMEQVKRLIGGVSQLRNEVMTNKPLSLLADDDDWNSELQKIEKREGRSLRWFSEPWLLVECYMYRRLQELVSLSGLGIDIFEPEKRRCFTASLPVAEEILSFTFSRGPDSFPALLQLCLWANRSDLSISAMQPSQDVSGPSQLTSLRRCILSDQSQEFFALLPCRQIDIVLDNAGFELVSDLCLAERLLSLGYCKFMRMHVKIAPWFVSDATETDIKWTLDELKAAGGNCSRLSESLQQLLAGGHLQICTHSYWTTWRPFAEMQCTHSGAELFKQLQQADCILLKGDLNYRKAVSDLAWPSTNPLAIAVGEFRPAPLLLVRTLKSDVVTGLACGVAEKAAAEREDWMVAGVFGVIQFLPAAVEMVSEAVTADSFAADNILTAS